MKLSFWTLGTGDWSNQDVAAAARRFGFQGVDLRCNNGGNLSLQSSAEEIDGLKRLFADAGIEIASMLAYNKRGNEQGVDWPAVEADLIANAQVAARLEAPAMRVNAGSPAAGAEWQSYLEGMVRAVSATLAAAPGVRLCVQNHPGSLTAAQCGQLATMAGDERFRVGLSPDHCVDQDEDPIAAAEQIAPHVGQVYLADRERLAQGGLKACLPGEGIVPNRAVLHALQQRGFDGWVSFKWERPTYPDLPEAEVALPRFISFMSSMSS